LLRALAQFRANFRRKTLNSCPIGAQLWLQRHTSESQYYQCLKLFDIRITFLKHCCDAKLALDGGGCVRSSLGF